MEAVLEGVGRCRGASRPSLATQRHPRFLRVRVERVRDFGGTWLGLQMVDMLDLLSLLDQLLSVGREDIPWSLMAGPRPDAAVRAFE